MLIRFWPGLVRVVGVRVHQFQAVSHFGNSSARVCPGTRWPPHSFSLTTRLLTLDNVTLHFPVERVEIESTVRA